MVDENHEFWPELARVSRIDDEKWAQLDAAVAIRHDVIHRNGKTTTGIAHKLGAQEVYDVISGAGDLVETVERAYNARFPHVYEAPNGESDF